jgi:hypothetical protein
MRFSVSRCASPTHHVISVSADVSCSPWLQPDHPDPFGDNLSLIASLLEIFVRHDGKTYAVFIDFCRYNDTHVRWDCWSPTAVCAARSLLQKGRSLEERSEPEKASFEKGLAVLHEWYSHPKTIVFKVTALPEGYPDMNPYRKFVFLPGTQPNKAAYSDRKHRNRT